MASSKKAWSESLKQKLNSILRQSRKPYIRPKKEKVVVPKPKEPVIVDNSDGVDGDVPQAMTEKPKPAVPKEDKDCAFFG